MRGAPRGRTLAAAGLVGAGAAAIGLIVSWQLAIQGAIRPYTAGLLLGGAMLGICCALVVLWCCRGDVRAGSSARCGPSPDRREHAPHDCEAEQLALLSRQQAVFEHLPAWVFLTDTAGRFVEANRAFGDLLLSGVDDPIGKTGREVFRAELVESREDELRQVVQEGKTLTKEESILLRDGRTVPMTVTLAPTRATDGRITGMVGVGLDITHQKQVEAELRQARRRAEEATAELAARAEELEGARQAALGMIEDLQRARRTAEAANQAKSGFLARASHEVRTPLAGIIGMADLALATELTAEQREYLEMVRGSAEALLGVVDDLLDFSKMEAGKLRVDPVNFSLQECLSGSLDAVALRAASKGLELVAAVDRDVPDALVGDPGRVRQILINLLGNAIKFTDAGEVVLTVSISSRDEQEVVLHFTVRDTGIGIAQADLGKIFEAFCQIDDSTRRKYGGTGLGLAISDQLARMMGGRIWVDSKVGAGSTFHVAALCGLQGPSAAAEDILRAEDLAELSGLDILVVEDNASNRENLMGLLAGWGMKPVAADSAEAALDALAQARDAERSFRVALVDRTLERPEGCRVVLKAMMMEGCGQPKLAAVMMLPADRRSEAVRYLERGAKACVVKPVLPQDLLGVLLAAVGVESRAKVGADGAGGDQPSGDGQAPLRVLLAEDNEVNQRLAARILEKRGDRVRTVSTGREAVAAYEEEPFDVILMDLEMPEMSGLKAAAAIRERELASGGHVPIVAMTAHAMRGDRQKCLDAGMDGYVAKPIRPGVLVEAIDEARRKALPRLRNPRCEPAPEAISADVLDLPAALVQVDGDGDLLREVAGIFLETCPTMVEHLRSACRAQNLAEIAQLAHTLKGAVSNFSARGAFEAAVNLQSAATQGRPAAIQPALASLEEHLARLQRALAALVGGQVPCRT